MLMECGGVVPCGSKEMEVYEQQRREREGVEWAWMGGSGRGAKVEGVDEAGVVEVEGGDTGSGSSN
jgi:hypothetical protein